MWNYKTISDSAGIITNLKVNMTYSESKFKFAMNIYSTQIFKQTWFCSTMITMNFTNCTLVLTYEIRRIFYIRPIPFFNSKNENNCIMSVLIWYLQRTSPLHKCDYNATRRMTRQQKILKTNGFSLVYNKNENDEHKTKKNQFMY